MALLEAGGSSEVLLSKVLEDACLLGFPFEQVYSYSGSVL